MASRPSSCSSNLMLTCALLLMCFAFTGTFSLKVITLQSIMIFTTHDWLPLEPTIYFRCEGENMTILPDVKETNFLYTFRGEESWQPLTELPDKKCKRCGLYERDTMKADDTFDEWELCPADFSNGTSGHFKKREFNATFRGTVNESHENSKKGSAPVSNTKERDSSSHRHLGVALVVMTSTLVSVIVVIGLIAGYKYWQKRKREKEQARFLKIFEEGDDIEDELGLGTII